MAKDKIDLANEFCEGYRRGAKTVIFETESFARYVKYRTHIRHIVEQLYSECGQRTRLCLFLNGDRSIKKFLIYCPVKKPLRLLQISFLIIGLQKLSNQFQIGTEGVIINQIYSEAR